MRIIIFGSGMSGLSMAIYAKRLKLNPIIVLKNTSNINYGESVHPGFETIFNMLKTNIDLNSSFIRTTGILDLTTKSAPTEKKFHQQDLWQGFQLERPKFDNMLIQHANQIGVKIIEIKRLESLNVDSDGKIISLTCDSQEIYGDIFIDATGRDKVLSKKYGINNRILSKKLVCAFGQFHKSENTQNQYPEFTWLKNGWKWESPISQNKLSWVILKFGDNKFKFDKKHQNSVLGYRNCTWQTSCRFVKNNLFLIGDAAFNFDPTASNGILKAFMSSIYLTSLLEKRSIKQVKSIYSDWTQNWANKNFKELNELYANQNIEIKNISSNTYDSIFTPMS